MTNKVFSNQSSFIKWYPYTSFTNMQDYTHINDSSSGGGNLSKVIEDPHNSILNLADRDVPILIGAVVGQ